jgi:hypothetical protein
VQLLLVAMVLLLLLLLRRPVASATGPAGLSTYPAADGEA